MITGENDVGGVVEVGDQGVFSGVCSTPRLPRACRRLVSSSVSLVLPLSPPSPSLLLRLGWVSASGILPCVCCSPSQSRLAADVTGHGKQKSRVRVIACLPILFGHPIAAL